MRVWLGFAALLLALTAAAAYADPDSNRDPLSGAPLPPNQRWTASPITDHLSLGVAFFDPGYRTTLRADPTQGTLTTGTLLSGEHDLGFPGHQQMALVDAKLRVRDRIKLRLSYFESNRLGSVLPSNIVVFGNQVFPAGQQFGSSLDWKMITVTGTWSFYRTDRLEIGIGAASYSLQVQTQGQTPATFQTANVSASGTVPALAGDVAWRVSPHASLTARGAYTKLAAAGFRGSLVDLYGDAQWRWNPNFATGVGYSLTRTSLNRAAGTSSPGIFDLDVSGPQVFVRFSF
jgi:hypothetical protein